MSPNSTLPLVAPSSQLNGGTTNDVIVNIAFGIAGTAISALTIYQGHRLWKLWRLHHAGHYDEERELGAISRTATDSYASDAPDPVHEGPLPHESSPQAANGRHMSVEAADDSEETITLPANIQQT